MTTGTKENLPSSTQIPGRLRKSFGSNAKSAADGHEQDKELEDKDVLDSPPVKWSMGILNDHISSEVPGSVLLIKNAPPPRTSISSVPEEVLQMRRNSIQISKKTADGGILLEPQPDDSLNDPLNWPKWRRDMALGSVGLYSMLGGGLTPILAAGFSNVAETYHVTVPKVALTTGLYMMGLGVGSILTSPTAILYGKRPVYLVSAILLIITSVWCAVSPDYNSLLVARIFQGIAVSAVECLPSATISEMFFLHERAFRIGIYTLLLLGGKNLVPLVSAVIIQALDWRWVFWVVTMMAGLCAVLLFLFVLESYWDRYPILDAATLATESFTSRSQYDLSGGGTIHINHAVYEKDLSPEHDGSPVSTKGGMSTNASALITHSEFASASREKIMPSIETIQGPPTSVLGPTNNDIYVAAPLGIPKIHLPDPAHERADRVQPSGMAPPTPYLHNLNSPWYKDVEKDTPTDYLQAGIGFPLGHDGPASESNDRSEPDVLSVQHTYTASLKQSPPQTYIQLLKPYRGRINHDKWVRVATRPFILYTYPAVLWSAVVYSCSIGWLIVLSESVTLVYRSKTTYDFSALSAGLVYISPFIGGILGTAVAGKVSDYIVQFMARANGGMYEPEFRLVMTIPVAITTVIGLMGFGWSAQVHDSWIVPTVFFGIISFGCALGCTTAITFVVDSYKQYAGEAMATLNFSKNIFHGLVFSLFFAEWLESDGSRMVFIWVGVIQLIFMVTAIPMYIFGKRARMWTYRKNLMGKF